MSSQFEEALKIGLEEALDVLQGKDSVAEAAEDVYQRLEELKNQSGT